MLFGKRGRSIKTILIVEDEPLVAFDNEHFLRDAGYHIAATVDTVAAALAALAAGPIDLVLADISLSDGSGLDVARDAQIRAVPLLFVTGACPVEARELSVGCLAKPYSQRDLLGAILAVEAQLAGRALRRLPHGLSLYR